MQLFLRELSKTKSIHCSVVSFHYPYKAKKYRWFETDVIALGGNNEKGIKRILLRQKALKEVEKLNNLHKVDQIHSFWLGECTSVGNKFAMRHGVKHSCTLMGQDALSTNNYWRKIKSLPQLICLSDFQVKTLQAHQAQLKPLLIPWGIEKLSADVYSKTTDIIGVGWINEIKRFDRFISIVELIIRERPNLKVEIVGEGNQLEGIKKLLADKKIEGNITLVGGLNREESLAHISKAKVLLHTSEFESFGLVFIEALALQTRVFSTAVGIAPEIDAITTYKTNLEAANGILTYLKSDVSEKEEHRFPIQSTVEAYLNSVF